jgi:hypothetical protein
VCVWLVAGGGRCVAVAAIAVVAVALLTAKRRIGAIAMGDVRVGFPPLPSGIGAVPVAGRWVCRLVGRQRL